ncbi:hypothetical protein [Methylocystis heyeri]|uniref:Uncharacterized protein n=1 Tax=Methylocystis heyeri TaxID=391905 RepID=A0A6B8KHH3_9HYPH|nr:hypothetical protein [Methylocystis heyeri]QGM47824.1 hypothetical protein H2LOC_020280 [Methylocystis heyeri]
MWQGQATLRIFQARQPLYPSALDAACHCVMLPNSNAAASGGLGHMLQAAPLAEGWFVQRKTDFAGHKERAKVWAPAFSKLRRVMRFASINEIMRKA